MKNKNKFIGDLGENIAKEYLIKKNINIIKCNFHSKFGEIDIIAQNKTYIIFIEVKTRRLMSAILGLECVNASKCKKIIKTACVYLSDNPSEKQIRFDMIEVKIDHKDLFVDLNHIENAFWIEDFGDIY